MADNIPDPLLEEGTRKASEALGLSLTNLSARLAESKDEADKWLYGTVLEQKAAKLAAEAAALPGSEEMLAFTAKLQNAGEVPDDYVNEVLVPLIREKSREASRTPLEAGKIAAATVEAVPAVAKDLVLSLKGMAQYAPQALVGAVGGVMEDIGIGATTPEQKQAAELFGAAAEQGTRETARLLQRGARKIGALTGGPGAGQAGRLVGNVEVMEDAELDKRIQSDLAYWRRQNLVESGQRDVGAIEALLFDAKSWNRRRDDILEANAELAKQGKPLLLVPPTWEEYSAARKAARPELSKEQVEMISPLGEVFDLTNYIPFGAGVKAAKAGGRVVAEKAIKTAAEEAAAQAAKQAAEVGTLRTLAGSAVESVGKGAGKLAEKPVLRGVASAAVATAAGADPVSATLAAILGTSRMTRALAKGGPEALESVGKAIKAPLPTPISNFVQIAKDTGAGAAYGTAGMVPFALAADSPEERGALLAGGIVYGGAGGGATSTVNSIGDFGKSFWSPAKDDPTAPRTKGTAYGTQYDALHSKVAATLDNPTYNRVEGLRALIRPFSDLYVLNEQDYAALPVPGIDLSQGVNSVVLPNGRKAVFVKLGGSALSHEVGEVIFESLPPAQQASILEAYESAYPADVRDAMRQAYEEKVGFRLSPERAAREVIAENFHAVLNGLPIANLGAKPGFAKSIYSAIGSIAEQLGLRNMTPGQGVVTSEALEYTPSFLVRRALENALESMQISAEAAVTPPAPEAGAAPTAPAPVPTPAAPVAPATTDVGALVPVPTELTKPSTELTPGAISGVTGGTPAPARAPTPAPAPRPTVADVTEQQRTTVAGTATPELQAQNEQVLVENLNKPIEVEYLSALASDQSGKASVRLRERQLADRNEQEGVPNPFRAIFGKVVIPTSIKTAGNGKRVIFGFSPDKLIRNIEQLRGWYLEKGDKAAADALYSPEFQQQVRHYLENQSNGYRGDGERIARPANTDPSIFPPENPDYTPVKLDENTRNLINFLMGLGPVSSLSMREAWNVFKLAELNGFRPASVEQVSPGRTRTYFNPLVQQLRDAGFDGSLNSAIEQLRVERMTSPAVPRPDLASIKPAVQGSVQAGFMPEGRNVAAEEQQAAAEMPAAVAAGVTTGESRPLGEENKYGNLPQIGVDPYDRYFGESFGVVPHRFMPAPQGFEITPPRQSYADGARQPGSKNLWVRQSEAPDNKGRVLVVQFEPNLMYPDGPDPVSTPYYDKLYSGVREGYVRSPDFWELPQWQAVVTKNLGEKVDGYYVSDIEEAKQFLTASNYDHVAFSVMDVSAKLTEQLAPSVSGTLHLGGYTDRSAIVAAAPNAKVYDNMSVFVESFGVPYTKGFDYRLFRGTSTIPRLEMSAGCRHRCTFCTIERKVTEQPFGDIQEQADSFKDLNSKLVYLNDKTFGQAEISKKLPEIYRQMKAANPAFEGFIIQTTAAQMKLFTDAFLQESGIRYVELGVETYNDPILKTLRKPATEKLIDAAVDKLRRNNIHFIPNIVIGFPGETAESYGRTKAFLEKNADVISHVNTYNLAVYQGTELSTQVESKTAADADENSPNKSFYKDPAIHQDFAKWIYEYGTRMLDEKRFMPEGGPETRIINIGLNVAGKRTLTYDRIMSALRAEGLNPVRARVEEDAPEPTFVATVSVKDEDAFRRLAGVLEQDAIAVYSPASDSGYLAGPRPENFGGKFLKEYFLMPEEGPVFMPAPPVESEAFKRWFGNSKVVDTDGKPLVVYHGTNATFNAFDPSKVGSAYGVDEQGFYFTSSRSEAEKWAEKAPKSTSPRVVPAYLSLQNPWEIDVPAGRSSVEYFESGEGVFNRGQQAAVAYGISSGYDGLVLRGERDSMYVAFEPTQIKSATGNVGTFDPNNPDIRYMPKAKPLKGSLGKGDIKFFHYSDTPNKGKIDPKFFGRSGVTGGREQAGLPRAYAYAEGSLLGQDAGLIDARKHYYEGVAPKGRIYDGVEDVLDYASNPNRAKADQMLVDKGFIGIYREGFNGVKQIEFFQPMEVTEAEKPESTGPLAEEAMPILPPLALEEIDYAAQDREFARKKAAGEPLYMPYKPITADEAMSLGRDVAGWVLPNGDMIFGRNSFVHEDLAKAAGYPSTEALRKAGAQRLVLGPETETDRSGEVFVGVDSMWELSEAQSRAVRRLAQDYDLNVRLDTGRSIAFMPKARGITSQLEATLQAIPEKASRQQIEAALRDGVKERGQMIERPVKAEEMRDIVDQTGRSFEDFLKENPQASRQEMLDFVLQNQIVVMEIEADPSKYYRYQEPGGENYREIIYQTPEAAPQFTVEDLSEDPAPGRSARDRQLFWLIKGPDNVYQLPKKEHRTLEAAKEYIVRTKQPHSTGYVSGHFDGIPNYLAHARVNERVVPFSSERIDAIGQKLAAGMKVKSVDSLASGAPEVGVARGYITEQEAITFSKAMGFRNKYHDSLRADGETMLFAEEIQSDLHQKARTEGYREPFTPDEESALLEQQMALNREYAAAVKSDNVPEMERLEAEKQALRNRFKRAKSGIPDAPFKKSWHEFVFKNLLRDAVEQGKDWLGWTTGDQQAARYDLSEQIAKVQVMPSRQVGRERLWAYDHDGKMVLNQQIDAGTADQYVGKEVAKKLYGAPELTFRDAVMDEDKTYREVSGIDLKVGGEGMKGFYDDILPRFVDKYLKRYGVKAETISVPEAGDVHAIRITPELRKDVLEKGQPAYMPDVSPALATAEIGFSRVPILFATDDLYDGPLVNEAP